MEADVSEGRIRVTHHPHVTIGDKPLDKCSTLTIAQEILRLLRVIDSQRAEIQRLRRG